MSWFRYHDEAMDDPKLLLLSDALFRAWVTLLCVASKNGGSIPSVQVAALALRVKVHKAGEIVGKLAAHGLLDPIEGVYFEPHNWNKRQYKSDVSTSRVKEFRERKVKRQGNVSQNVSETAPEAETDSETERSQRSLTSSLPKTTSSKGNLSEIGEENRWTPPAHCSVSRDKERIYVKADTAEWGAYADDYRTVHRQEPQPNKHGGKWFRYGGEPNLEIPEFLRRIK